MRKLVLPTPICMMNCNTSSLGKLQRKQLIAAEQFGFSSLKL